MHRSNLRHQQVECHSLVVDSLRWPVFVRLEFDSFDVVGVLLNVGLPLLWKIVQCEYSRNWADWYVSAAVYALDRANEELVVRGLAPKPEKGKPLIMIRQQPSGDRGWLAKQLIQSIQAHQSEG